jgi:NAD(P)-dependent dehydrogenase (short-subunit alcohol dehydrogenase family)
MDLNLAGQTAMIAGGAKGIGRAIALAFATEGADIVLLDIDRDVSAVAGELAKNFGVRALPYSADVTDFAAIQRVAGEVQSALGRVDHLAYAVGIGSGKYGFPFWNLEPADWGRVLQVNVHGAVNFLHAISPCMVQARSGTVLFISSVAGQIGSQTDPPYSASKAALINFAQCAARDLAPHGVRVNTLCPGMVKTALNRSVWEAWARQQPPDQRQSYEQWAEEKIRRVVPLGRWQEPEDIAAMAVFLASPRARNITGQTINVDGGFVMHW